ncbi:MAG: hypothetical protein ABL898_10300 [Hyphomicrobiaceae bacterium]|nr:hypothetical protein [Hyphomicrobiaceae bacterium]
MTKITTGLAAFLAIAISTSIASASEKSKKKYEKSDNSAERTYVRPDANGWYPRDTRLLKFGSQLWWEQMEREGRTGRRDW